MDEQVLDFYVRKIDEYDPSMGRNLVERIWTTKKASAFAGAGYIDVMSDATVRINMILEEPLTQNHAARLSRMLAYAAEVARKQEDVA